MYLLLSILAFGILGTALFIMFDLLIAGIIVISVLGGCMIRALYLLTDIHKKISKLVPKQSKAEEVYENYLKEKAT